MGNESRKDPRAHVAGVRAAYERADGESSDDDVRNVGRGGVFIATAKPLAVGTLVHVELSVPGDADPLTATGRVVWTRDIAVNDDRPAGMGVKFIDVEEGALEVLSRLVREHEPSPKAGTPAFSRERTILGVAPEAAAPPPEPAREPEPEPEPEPPPREPKRAPVAAVKAPEKRGGGRLWLALLIAVVIVVALNWDRIASMAKP